MAPGFSFNSPKATGAAPTPIVDDGILAPTVDIKQEYFEWITREASGLREADCKIVRDKINAHDRAKAIIDKGQSTTVQKGTKPQENTARIEAKIGRAACFDCGYLGALYDQDDLQAGQQTIE